MYLVYIATAVLAIPIYSKYKFDAFNQFIVHALVEGLNLGEDFKTGHTTAIDFRNKLGFHKLKNVKGNSFTIEKVRKVLDSFDARCHCHRFVFKKLYQVESRIHNTKLQKSIDAPEVIGFT